MAFIVPYDPLPCISIAAEDLMMTIIGDDVRASPERRAPSKE